MAWQDTKEYLPSLQKLGSAEVISILYSKTECFSWLVFKGCLNKLAFQARNPGVICCPTCKLDTTLFPKTFESVRNLPKNFGVLEILEGKEEAKPDGIHKEKEKNKYLCPEHDEALKVYCYTDNCLICIYCQVCVVLVNQHCWQLFMVKNKILLTYYNWGQIICNLF